MPLCSGTGYGQNPYHVRRRDRSEALKPVLFQIPAAFEAITFCCRLINSNLLAADGKPVELIRGAPTAQIACQSRTLPVENAHPLPGRVTTGRHQFGNGESKTSAHAIIAVTFMENLFRLGIGKQGDALIIPKGCGGFAVSIGQEYMA